MRIEGTASAAANNNQVINNSFTVPTIGVSLCTNANGNNIQANQFVNSFTAFDFNGDAAASSGNSFSNNIISGGSGGNYPQSVTASVISGNQFLGSGTAAGYTLNVTLAAGSQQAFTTISNNIAYDDQATQTQGYGLLIFGSGPAFDLTMIGNDFARDKTAAIAETDDSL